MSPRLSDLDSAASSIGYAYLQAKSNPQAVNIVPLIQVAREDIRLRPENEHAFKQATLNPTWEDLLCLDDVPTSLFPSHKFVLVDHNRLSDRFRIPGEEPSVVGILDHHEDEEFHLDANPRKIQIPTGSCASLVTIHFRDSKAWTSELATVLLSAIVVDTGGLKSGGKAVQTDYEAAQFLLPLSSSQSSFKPDDAEGTFKSLAMDLLTRKSDISHLSNRDLLRRDYKHYQYATSFSTKSIITVGLSTVPVDLKDWVHKDPHALLDWMKERDLMIHGSLTTFRRLSKKGNVKHKRQQLWIFRKDVPEELEKMFWHSLESSEALEVEIMEDLKEKLGLEELREIRVKAYKQGNVNATRKVVAPLVKQIVEFVKL